MKIEKTGVFDGMGGTLAVFVPSNAGLVIAADKRQTPMGVFCDGIEKILRPDRPARTAVVVTGLISLREMPDLSGQELCDYVANTPAPIDFGRTTLAFLSAENTPVAQFDGQKFTDAVFADVGPYLAAGKLSGLAGSRIAQIIIASYDPVARTSSILAHGVDLTADSRFLLQPLPVTASTTLQGTSFNPDSERILLPFGEVPYLQQHVLSGHGQMYLTGAYSEFLSKTRVRNVEPTLAGAAALEVIEATAKTTEIIPAPSGIGGGSSVLLLGEETVTLK
ncbi:hypothetical protein IVB16_27435 [Bradyrhizobium sp. 183]|uniref:hypothetical protein n=1 Tax=unclassified Bradyrhizobium TaxID=2631580 RepID=UPI001FFF5EE0|nr:MULTISPECIES: hypothetical protein [unclassified Bradyrhizobium]UPJ78584.1 hypothetical protein IVB17_27435 [Bradyrhizobium sp. 184]UPJ86379.1 hypothetical protein IVB16_27435 [Bradyrhizobium sp. 183]